MDRLFPVRQWQEWRKMDTDWCTDIFDNVAGYVIRSNDYESFKVQCLATLIVQLDNRGWAYKRDSEYLDDPSVKAAFKQVHPEWYTEVS